MIIKNFFKAVNKLCCHLEKCTQKRNFKKRFYVEGDYYFVAQNLIKIILMVVSVVIYCCECALL